MPNWGYKIITVIAFISFCTSGIYAQKEIIFDHLTIDDGLSQNSVNCILQDKSGFIWIGTLDGLNRYDGNQFTIFKPVQGNATSISDHVIRAIYEDQKGIIWIGTGNGGLNRYDRETGTFQHYSYNPENPSGISSNSIYCITEDRQGQLWIGTYGGGVNCFDKKTGRFISYHHDPENPQSLSSNTVRVIFEDSKGNLWIGTDNGGLNRLDRKKGMFVRYQHDPEDPSTISHNVVMSIYEDTNGYLWIGTWGGGLNRFDPSNQTFLHYLTGSKNSNALNCNIVTSIHGLSNGQLLIGTWTGGLNGFDPETNRFIQYTTSTGEQQNQNIPPIWTLCEDRSGVIWIGTENAGINKFDSRKKTFLHIKKNPNNVNSLSHNNVYALHEDNKGGIWISTRGGGLNYSPDFFHTFIHYFSVTGKKNTIRSNALLSFTEGSPGLFYIGSDGEGIDYFDTRSGIISNIVQNKLSNNAVHKLFTDHQGIIWIGTWGGGLNKYDPKTGNVDHYPVDKINSEKNTVIEIFEDSKNRLWLGTYGRGLALFDRLGEKIVFYSANYNDTTSLSNNIVQVIYEDRQGTIWVGTGGGGLNRIAEIKKTGNKFFPSLKFQQYTEKNGLPNNVIAGILEDDKGNLWISTNKGISKFNPSAGSFRNYDKQDGLQSNVFNPGACMKSKNGKLIFGGINGLTVFDPSEIKDNPYIPPVAITGIQIANKPVGIGEKTGGYVILKKSLSCTEEIVLSYQHRVLSLEFTVMHYASPSKNQCAYMLEGFDKEWKYAGNRRYVTYTNLPPGSYTFRVKGANSDGIWNQKGASLKITVNPPYWQTWWFRIMFFTVIIGIIVGWYSLRIRNISRQKKQLEIQVEQRTLEIQKQKEEILNQHNEITAHRDFLKTINEQLAAKNRQITDSIAYSKKIQDAILPSENLLKKNFPDSFILYKPKDIVSGDFYWFSERNNKFILAVVDCTGHGIPGAFMSMIGNTLLNEIVHDKKTIVPSEILEHLNEGINYSLRRGDNSNIHDDGMDISLCLIDYEKKEIQIACANHPVYIIQNNILEIIHGDIFSIGGGLFSKQSGDYFTNYELDLINDTKLYLFSDGIQDQFGGDRNEKFMTSRLQKLIKDNQHKTMEEQKQILDQTFLNWKGNFKQIDDILMIGINTGKVELLNG